MAYESTLLCTAVALLQTNSFLKFMWYSQCTIVHDVGLPGDYQGMMINKN